MLLAELDRMRPVVDAAIAAVDYAGETPPDWNDAKWLALEASVEALLTARRGKG